MVLFVLVADFIALLIYLVGKVVFVKTSFVFDWN